MTNVEFAPIVEQAATYLRNALPMTIFGAKSIMVRQKAGAFVRARVNWIRPFEYQLITVRPELCPTSLSMEAMLRVLVLGQDSQPVALHWLDELPHADLRLQRYEWRFR